MVVKTHLKAIVHAEIIIPLMVAELPGYLCGNGNGNENCNNGSCSPPSSHGLENNFQDREGTHHFEQSMMTMRNSLIDLLHNNQQTKLIPHILWVP